ncbi:MAG TPA: gamma-glutamyltransferase [Polyangium sp.]|nr:gamma-glutamyltransferase [Polyangium sp.]
MKNRPLLRIKSTWLPLTLTSLLSGCGSPPEAHIQSKPVEVHPQPTITKVEPPQAPQPAVIPIATFPERQRNLYESTGDEYMVVTQGDAATRAARKMFELGGNAIDAAAAASFAIAVERPQSTGIAGGGFLLAYLADKKEIIAVDFREVAPEKANRDMFLDPKKKDVIPNASTDGGLASGVPGMVAGVLSAHEKYGKLDRSKILQPAIDLAENGFEVYAHLAAAIADRKDILAKSPEALGIFFKGGKADQPLKVGDKIRQIGLAKVLREISKAGRDGFYKGWVAKALVEEQKRQGGFITAKDLESYEVKYRTAVHGVYGPYEVYSMSPPSSGGVHVVEMLNILEGFGDKVTDAYGPQILHRTASSMELAYFDRANYLGDSDFVKVPVAGLTSQQYADELRKRIEPDKALHLTAQKVVFPTKYESHETTHFTIADKAGNVVASTQTINGWLGSGVVVKGGGFVLNNEMDDFSAKPGVPNKFGVTGGEENAVAPRKRPLSSMSPTIVMRDGKPVLALGTPSGSQIITCVTLSILNYVTYGMPLWESITAVRYHHQWTPDVLLVETPGFPEASMKALGQMGYQIKEGGIGCKVQAIAYENGRIHGVSDPRGEGLAAGEKPIPEVVPMQPKSTKVNQD